MKKFLACLHLIFGLGIASFSGTASALSIICIDATQVGVPACAGNAACIAQIQANHPECFGTTSSTAASSQGMYSTVVQQMLAVSKAVGSRTVAGQNRSSNKTADSGQYFSGMAAGNSAAQWNAWGSVNNDRNKYDRGSYVDAAAAIRNNKYDIDVTNVVLGADYQLSPTLAPGLSIAFDNSSGTGESFLAGVSQGIAVQKTRGYTVAPYVGWQINQDWSLDATLGFGNVKTDTDGIKGSTDRLFFGGNLNYVTWNGNWQCTGKGSYLHGEEKSGNLTSATGALLAGTAVTNKIDQLRLEAQAGYWMNDNAMPYFGLSYTNDINRSTSVLPTALVGKEIGRSAIVWAAGINFFSLQNSMTGGISYNHETGRTYSRSHSLVANINFRF